MSYVKAELPPEKGEGGVDGSYWQSTGYALILEFLFGDYAK